MLDNSKIWNDYCNLLADNDGIVNSFFLTSVDLVEETDIDKLLTLYSSCICDPEHYSADLDRL